MATQLFKHVLLFKGLSDQELESLADLAITRRFPRERIILLAEEEGDTMFIIQHGRVKVSLTSEDGREIILDILEEGDFFGEMSLLDGRPRSATVTAMEATELSMLRRSDFLQLIQKAPQIAMKLLTELTTRLRRADTKIEQLVFLDVTRRLLRTLMQLGERYGIQTQEGVMISNRPTHKDLGNMIGARRETVSRILKQLERKGHIRCYGTTLILTNPP